MAVTSPTHRPPGCFSEFIAQTTSPPQIDFDLMPNGDIRFFSLACPCGCDRLRVRSVLVPHYYLKNPVAYGPVALRCVACDRERICFDPTRHGYDAEIDHFPPTGPYEGEIADHRCLACGTNSFLLTACLEYFKPAAAEPARPHEEDMFAYFTLVGKCASCSTQTTMADVECA